MKDRVFNYLNLIWNPIKQIFDYRSRSTRKEFFVPFVFYSIIFFILALGLGALGGFFIKPELFNSYIVFISYFITILLFILILPLSARRLHDANLSFGYYFLIIISGFLSTTHDKLITVAPSLATLCLILSIVLAVIYIYLHTLPSHKGTGFNFSINARLKRMSKVLYWRIPVFIMVAAVIFGVIALDKPFDKGFFIGSIISQVILVYIFYYYVLRSEKFENYKTKQKYFLVFFVFSAFTLYVQLKGPISPNIGKSNPNISSNEEKPKSLDELFEEKDKIVQEAIPENIPKKEGSTEKKKNITLNKQEVNKRVTEIFSEIAQKDEKIYSKVKEAESFTENENIFAGVNLTNEIILKSYIEKLKILMDVSNQYHKEYLSMINFYTKDLRQKFGKATANEFKRTMHLDHYKKTLDSRLLYYKSLEEVYKFLLNGIYQYGFYHDSRDDKIIMPNQQIEQYDQLVNKLQKDFDISEKYRLAYVEIFEKEKFNIANVPSQYDASDDIAINPKDYKKVISQLIAKNKNYPQKAQLDKIEGDVKAKFKIDRSGNLIEVKITESSGSDLLDTAAISAIKKTAPFPKPPKELLGDHAGLTLTIPFDFNLK